MQRIPFGPWPKQWDGRRWWPLPWDGVPSFLRKQKNHWKKKGTGKQQQQPPKQLFACFSFFFSWCVFACLKALQLHCHWELVGQRRPRLGTHTHTHTHEGRLVAMTPHSGQGIVTASYLPHRVSYSTIFIYAIM